MQEKDNLVIVDGKSVFYRGYYAMGHLALPDGTPTGGVYGFASMLIETMLEATEAEGIVSHTLEVRKSNKAARRLYGNFDFKETSIRSHYYSDNGEDAIIMWRMGELAEE